MQYKYRNEKYLPLQKEMSPSFLSVNLAQSIIPEYGCFKVPCFIISFWFCIKSFTRSIGAAVVFDMIAAAPDMTKIS